MPDVHTLEFEHYFPVGCPPADATLADGRFYRLVNNDPPQDKDFLNHMERKLPCIDKCLACGLSVFSEQTHAAELFQFFADKHGLAAVEIGHLLAEIVLTNDQGLLKHTPRRGNSHHTWWPCKSANRLKVFVRVCENLRDALGY